MARVATPPSGSPAWIERWWPAGRAAHLDPLDSSRCAAGDGHAVPSGAELPRNEGDERGVGLAVHRGRLDGGSGVDGPVMAEEQGFRAGIGFNPDRESYNRGRRGPLVRAPYARLFAGPFQISIIRPLSAMGLTISFSASINTMISTKGEKSSPPMGGSTRRMGASNGSLSESSSRVSGL